MKTKTQERMEEHVIKQLHEHLTKCIDILNKQADAGVVFQPYVKRIDAMLLVCRQHIKMLGQGYSTTE
jgi:hypothetical protein